MSKAHLAQSRHIGPAFWIAGLALGILLFFFAIGYGGNGVASAEAGREVGSKTAQTRASLKIYGTHGYEVSIAISNQGGSVVASMGHTAALYSTRQSQREGRHYQARFGKFGRINMQFDPDAGQHNTCSQDHGVVSVGTFSGTIQFHGEESFTKVFATRVSGTVIRPSCSRATQTNGGNVTNKKTGRRTSGPSLHALTVEKGDVVQFHAGADAIRAISGWETGVGIPLGLSSLRGKPEGFSAISLGHKFGVQIVRFAAAATTKDALSISGAGKLIARPSAPFAGVGHMNICHPASWHGDIRVQFPGREARLAGTRTLAVVKPSPANCAS
jgi:hypothetical protein